MQLTTNLRFFPLTDWMPFLLDFYLENGLRITSRSNKNKNGLRKVWLLPDSLLKVVAIVKSAGIEYSIAVKGSVSLFALKKGLQ